VCVSPQLKYSEEVSQNTEERITDFTHMKGAERFQPPQLVDIEVLHTYCNMIHVSS
jgi:hypothetical protein